jgi:7-cyano-7-deazaguanine synthase
MKTILIYSGGLDSTSLLYWLKKRGDEVRCLGFDYGQRHKKELAWATLITAQAQVPFTVVDLQSITPLLVGSSQTDPNVPVPEGRYDEPNMKLTVVPNRNMIMLSIAMAQAISLKFDAVAYAAHAGDHTIYPDCRAGFVNAMRMVAERCDWHTLSIETPFLMYDKGECLQQGHLCGAPLVMTWSCYKGAAKHCGKCGACTERKEAFQKARVTDPTQYEA